MSSVDFSCDMVRGAVTLTMIPSTANLIEVRAGSSALLSQVTIIKSTP